MDVLVCKRLPGAGRRTRPPRLWAWRGSTCPPSPRLLPVLAFLQELVEEDNSRFEEWCHEMAEMRKQSVARGKVKHEEVKELYQKLPAKAGL